MLDKTGTIRAISKNGKAFQLEGDETWYSGFDLVALKGDKVKFEHHVNGQWNNFKNLEVIEKAKSISKVSSDDFRDRIDAGNIVKCAVDIFLQADWGESFSDTVNMCFGEFIRIHQALKDYGNHNSIKQDGETK
jgi:hypothetical protein